MLEDVDGEWEWNVGSAGEYCVNTQADLDSYQREGNYATFRIM